MNDNQSFNRTLYQEASTMSFFDHGPTCCTKANRISRVCIFSLGFHFMPLGIYLPWEH
jgi:hypothetical protein